MDFKASSNDFIKQCKRVIKVSKKPNRDEYIDFTKVTALGIVIIGVIGFIIVIIGQLLGL